MRGRNVRTAGKVGNANGHGGGAGRRHEKTLGVVRAADAAISAIQQLRWEKWMIRITRISRLQVLRAATDGHRIEVGSEKAGVGQVGAAAVEEVGLDEGEAGVGRIDDQ